MISSFRTLDWTLGRQTRKTEVSAETGNCLLGRAAGAPFDKAFVASTRPPREPFRHQVGLDHSFSSWNRNSIHLSLKFTNLATPRRGTPQNLEYLSIWNRDSHFVFFHGKSLLFLGGGVPHRTACGILVPQPGIEPSPNHWTAREFPTFFYLDRKVMWLTIWVKSGK